MGKYLAIMMLLLAVGLRCSSQPSQEKQVSADTAKAKALQGTDTTEGKDPISPHPATDRGVGPISEVKLGPINQQMADSGKTLFEDKCSMCHELNGTLAGPALGNITQVRSPEFIMNLLLNTSAMEQKDTAMAALVSQFGMRMPDLRLGQPQAREILEYLRSVAPKDEKK